MQLANSLDAIAPCSVGTTLTCLFQVKVALLTAILLLVAEWLPRGWKRRRVVILCAIALAADLVGTATALAVADRDGFKYGSASRRSATGRMVAP